MIDFDSIRASKEDLLAELGQAGAKRDTECPFHEDSNKGSMNVYQSDDGGYRAKCMAAGCGWCGDVLDVRARNLNTTREDLIKGIATAAKAVSRPFPAPRTHATMADLEAAALASDSRPSSAIAHYVYVHPTTGHHDLVVIRIDHNDGSKTFRQAHQTDGGYVLKAPPAPLPLYNRSRVAQAQTVVVVEGEKCVHALHEVGITATTSPGGSEGAHKADWSPLAGKDVIIWPDHDKPNAKTGKCSGLEYAKAVVSELQRLPNPPTIHQVDPSQLDLPQDGSDCVEYLAKYDGQSIENKRIAVEAVLSFADSVGPASELQAELEAAIAGQRKPWPLKFSALHHATRALLPGTVTILCGSEGATKTFVLLELLTELHKRGLVIGCMMLEETRPYHLRRILAQESGLAAVTREEWCEANPDLTRQAYKEHEGLLNSIGGRIDTAPTGELKPELLIDWVDGRAKAGAKVLAIDPITAMDCGSKQWVGDLQFLTKAKRIVEEHQAALILVTHPKTGATQKGKVIGLDAVAGGAAYRRFSQTVIWLEYTETKEGNFKKQQGIVSETYNREMRILKARNSFGKGLRVGFFFNPDTFRSEERGLFAKQEAHA